MGKKKFNGCVNPVLTRLSSSEASEELARPVLNVPLSCLPALQSHSPGAKLGPGYVTPRSRHKTVTMRNGTDSDLTS